ncbi:MAG: PTS sugar transporter [Microbacterium sp.]|jgi:PTS system cellobiose-specific IIB component|uniref:PTS sugar transporter subunit IIB n=1 Tax=Microbacterium TaxID=33882 RepID=UPI0008D8E1F0|nr:MULTISPECIES: PTS sugar transporter [Microbacterium]MAY50190.1 PTS sugar transporter [Microbacterium sp.]HAS31370.1 PTS sugar transporter [Microbacterium sp.]HBR90094.1 PTS sugar transporter [Microbacterium sp.]HBS75222.1 PTS sugar transporter [Microbacterium sp.]|tara:strand:- start:950 stop:1306 length:357 start_codon:yes stop_codon:yes gene_type:complete
MRIVVVCGAGASSTFIVQRLRQAAREQGVDVTATAATAQSLPIDLETADLVMVGPHLHDDLDRIRAEAAHVGSIVALMPPDVYADKDASRTLALVREAVAGTPHDTVFAHTRIREDHS